MRYSEIKEYDVANGNGIRVSLWVQGCSIKCKGCFNPTTWNFECGKEFADIDIEYIINLLKDRKVVTRDFSILGGNPTEECNIKMLTKLLLKIRSECPWVNVWMWSGHKVEHMSREQIDVVNLVDVLVDGKFEIDKKDLSLKWRGSSNQRIIDVQKSLKLGQIVSYMEE